MILIDKLAAAPHLFFGIDSAFELFALIVAATIAFYGYKIYKVSGEQKYYHFALSFLFLAVALLARGLLDVYSFDFIKQFGFQQFTQLISSSQSALYNTGADIYRLLYLAGYALLIKAIYKLEDFRKTVPLLLAVFIGVLGGKYFAFIIPNIVTLGLLLVLVKYFYGNYSEKKSLSAKLTLAAFILISLSEILFILTIIGSNAGLMLYVLAHISRMVGFLLLAYNLYVVFKK